MGRLSLLSSFVLLLFQLTPCRLAFTLAKATWCANQLSGRWQGIWMHSGVPLTSLFNYHCASRTQRERESLDPDDLSSSPHQEPASKELLSWHRFRRWRRLKVTDKDFIDRWSLDLIMSICGFQPRQMHSHCPSGRWSLSVNGVIIDSRGIHQQKALIHPTAPQLFVAQFTNMPSPSTDGVQRHVHICKSVGVTLL